MTWLNFFELRGTLALPARAGSDKRHFDDRHDASTDTLHNADLTKVTKSHQNET
jgi:hypothetical protein